MLDKKTEASESLENIENSKNEIKKEEEKDESKEINNEKKINDLIKEKNNFIEKITSIAKEDLEKNNHFKSFLFSYQRKRTAMEEEDESNISLILRESEIQNQKKLPKKL
jgi:hypothetical protein